MCMCVCACLSCMVYCACRSKRAGELTRNEWLLYYNGVSGLFPVSDKTTRDKRAAGDEYVVKPVLPKSEKCFYARCIPPPDQNTLPPVRERPSGWVWWSNTTIWPGGFLPTDDSDVTVEKGQFLICSCEYFVCYAISRTWQYFDQCLVFYSC